MEKVKISVLDAATLGEDLDLSPLNELGEISVFASSLPEDICRNLGDAQVAVINKVKMNAETLKGNTTLKLICIFATGFDNVDIAYCKERGIAVCNVVGYSTDSVAQLTVSMALSLVMHLPEYNRYVEDGSYSKGNVANRLVPVYHEIAGKTWGIAGYGNIGKKVAAVARAFGCRVLAYKRNPVDEVECVDLDTLLKESDIVSLHLPLSDATRGLIGKEQIAHMKKDAILINVARGAVTDEAALAEAIKEHRIGGIAVDVYSKEPFKEDHPFYDIKDLPNVCLTPHMAWGA